MVLRERAIQVWVDDDRHENAEPRPRPAFIGQGEDLRKSSMYIYPMSHILSHLPQVWVDYFASGRLPKTGLGQP